MAGQLKLNGVTLATEENGNISLEPISVKDEIQLNSVTLATESGGVITLNNNVSLDNVVFPTGHVIQVVYAESTTATSITSTTQGSGTSTGLSATITPVSSSNKLFISYVGSFMLAQHSAPGLSVEIYDGSSVVATENGTWGIYINGDGDEYNNNYKYPFQAYITPSGSGAITYTVRAWKTGNAATAQPNSRLSTLTIMEIQQ